MTADTFQRKIAGLQGRLSRTLVSNINIHIQLHNGSKVTTLNTNTIGKAYAFTKKHPYEYGTLSVNENGVCYFYDAQELYEAFESLLSPETLEQL